MSNPIYDFIKLQLTIFIDLIFYCIYKNSRLSKVVAEEHFELFLRDEFDGYILNFVVASDIRPGFSKK